MAKTISKKKEIKKVNGNNLLYHILQKQIFQVENTQNLSDETKLLIEKLLIAGGIWFKKETYLKFPVLLPYVIRNASCREKDQNGKDKRGLATEKGFLQDDNSSIKDIPNSLLIESKNPELNGRKIGIGFVASHVWRILENQQNLLASQFEATNSFIPNLVWLPSQLSKLTDREGSYAQKVIQHISCRLYRNEALRNPSLQKIWEYLKDPDLKLINKLNLDDLNYFEYNEKWVNRRSEKREAELKSIINILEGKDATIKKINVGAYIPSLKERSEQMRDSDKEKLKKWLKDNL